MSGKAKKNITLEDLGTLYTEDYKTVFRLAEYIPPAPEPEVAMLELGANGDKLIRGPLSQFAGYARLNPDRELPVPKPKRPYTRHEKPVAKGDIDLSQLDIKTPEPGTSVDRDHEGAPLGLYIATIGDHSATGGTLREAIRNLLNPLGLDTDEKIVEAINASTGENKKTLLAVFGG